MNAQRTSTTAHVASGQALASMERPPRVLHVVESFASGVLSILLSACLHQAESGYDVHVAHSVRQETPADYAALFPAGTHLHRLEMTREVSLWADLHGLTQLTALIRRLRPDILHLHSSKAGFLGRIAGRLNGTARVFYSPHGVSILRRDISRLARNFYIAAERLASWFGGYVIACSESEYNEILREIRPRKMVVIENGITLLDRARRPRARGPLRIGTAGRIAAQKNPAAFGELARSLPNYRFLWIGDGAPDSRQLLSDASIEVTGWLSPVEATASIGDLDIYVQTSLWEGMPVTVLEAMALELPVVGLDAPGTRDAIVHGETGYIAKTGAELTRFVASLAESPEERTRMGANGRRLALERFSVERMNQSLVALYEGIVGEGAIRTEAGDLKDATAAVRESVPVRG